MGTLNSSQFSNDFTMALSHFLIAFLALGLVAAEEMEFEEGLSADEILNMEFPSKMRFNFNKVSGTSNFGMPYDYCSLMHYGATAFGGRKFTIVPKDLDYLAVIGRSHVNGADLTYTDATIVNKMYGCSNSVAQTSCPKIPCTSRWSSSTCNSLRG